MTKKTGRKAESAGTNMRSYNVVLDDETRKVLRESGLGSMSAAIRIIAKKYGGVGEKGK